MEIHNVTIIWHNEIRRFENVKNIKNGKGFIFFTDGNIRRCFSEVPYEIESYYPEDEDSIQ